MTPEVRVPAKSGRCGPQRCAGVLNESFRTSEDLNESFKTWGERVTGGGVAWPRDFAGTLTPDAVNESFTSSAEPHTSQKPHSIFHLYSLWLTVRSFKRVSS
ncbi:hypothetical protein H4696_003608 [Amycolatopsis lexingtonensis]|uniref:Uncharacterized protein n=1 Tax=Amycolatopsis lexingtonensis TaxID=218822 RepID=A0ABR9I010_9PSEU|nr:hypothetical protein [Amycolatopsis lexingtonensis]